MLKMHMIATGLALAATLAGAQSCAPLARAPVLSASAKYSFEAAYNAAATLYLDRAPTMAPDTKARLKAALLTVMNCEPPPAPGVRPTCHGALPVAIAAADARDAMTVAAQLPAIQFVIDQVYRELAPTAAVPVATAAAG